MRVPIVDRDRDARTRAETERPQRLVIGEVKLLRAVHGELGKWANALLEHVDTVLSPNQWRATASATVFAIVAPDPK